MAYDKIQVPADGEKITISENGVLNVPDNPIIGYIEGDGAGPDIWNAAVRVFDSAVEKAYNGKNKIVWMKVFAGENSWEMYNKSPEGWLPQETIDAINEYLVAIKGPISTPLEEGIPSINAALKQKLDLYVCLKPVRWISGVPSPVISPQHIDMVIFRENTEDVYAGIEYETGSGEAEKIKALLTELNAISKIRFPETTSFGLKPVSKDGSFRLVRAAIQYAIDNNRDSVTLVHNGNVMKLTEGNFMKWGYELAKTEFNATELGGGPWCTMKNPKTGKTIIIKDLLANSFLQQILSQPKEYSVIATLNLNGDYISDTLAAQVGGTGIAPGANINYMTGCAIFEATHDTIPKYALQDKANPTSIMLSGEMMMRYLGWNKASELIIKGIEKSIRSKIVTYDFAKLIDDANEVKCSKFADSVIANM